MGSIRIEDECPELIAKRDRQSCEALLRRLQQHHDYSVRMPSVEAELISAQKEVEKAISTPPKNDLWFEPLDDIDPPPVKLTAIKKAACGYFEIEMIDLISSRRLKSVTYPRHIGFYLAKTRTTKSYPEIGRHFGGKDHTTVIHGVRKIERLVRSDWKVAYDVAAVEARL